MASVKGQVTKLILAKKGTPNKTFSHLDNSATSTSLYAVAQAIAEVLEVYPETIYKQVDSELQA